MNESSGSLFSVFRIRDFAIFFTGQAISRLGDSMFTIAIVWLMHTLTNSSLWMALVLAAGVIPRVVFAPFSGAFVNRWPKRGVMIRTDLVRFVLLTALTVAAASHLSTPWLLVLVNFLVSIAGTFASPAYVVLQKRLVPEDQLLQANSVSQTALNITQVLGFAVGGTLIGWLGAQTAFAVDAVSFLCSAVTSGVIRVDEPAQERGPLTGTNLLLGIRNGVRVALQFPLVRMLTPVLLAYTFFVIGVENLLLVQYIANTLHRGSAAVGAVNACMAIGELAGSLSVTAVTRRVPMPRLLVINMMITGLCVSLTGVMPWVAGIAVLSAVGGFCMSMVNVAFFTSIQKAIPSESLATVWGMVGSVFTVVVPMGQLVFGAIGEAVAPGRMIAILGLCAAVCGAAPVWLPALRRQMRSQHLQTMRPSL
ncbi:MFS transporter [Alicyclobacillus sp.]|uniref:MFS transporter n=1 Tax=Alicyclobacillus sp. TaxID=61169 RepID=UPI0025C26A7B|nr:MFS transporter [Alicyclobacillus sp.]MCL6516262.1 MFS transporter [Alicyclobacillus sp.]